MFIALGVLLIAMGTARPTPRWAPWLVALTGFVVTAVTLQRFRGDEYQGTGSLILFVVFGVYLATPIAAKWQDVLFGPVLIVGGIIGYVRGQWDHGLAISAGVLCLLISAGRRNAHCATVIEALAVPLRVAALILAGIGLVSVHHSLVWPGVLLF